MTTLVWANLALLALLAALVYRLFAALDTRPRAAAATVVFLGLFGFSQYVSVGNYNYVTPYRHELTHGLLLLLVLGVALVRSRETGRPAWAVLGGACLGLLALMKLELWPAGGRGSRDG